MQVLEIYNGMSVAQRQELLNMLMGNVEIQLTIRPDHELELEDNHSLAQNYEIQNGYSDYSETADCENPIQEDKNTSLFKPLIADFILRNSQNMSPSLLNALKQVSGVDITPGMPWNGNKDFYQENVYMQDIIDNPNMLLFCKNIGKKTYNQLLHMIQIESVA